jgi:hypothetical protein
MMCIYSSLKKKAPLLALLWSTIASYPASLQAAQVYFCAMPAITLLLHPVPPPPPSQRQNSLPPADEELAKYFDPLLVKALLTENYGREYSSEVDFFPYLKKSLLKRKWKKLGAWSRRSLLRDEKFKDLILAQHLDELPGKFASFSVSADDFRDILRAEGPALIPYVDSKTVLDFLVNIAVDQSRFLPAAFAFLCAHDAQLRLDLPTSTSSLTEIKRQLVKFDDENTSNFAQLLASAFPLQAPTTIYSDSLTHYLSQVKDLVILSDWPATSRRSSSSQAIEHLRLNVGALAESYQNKLSTSVKAALRENYKKLERFINAAQDSIDHFQEKRAVFTEELRRRNPTQLKAINPKVGDSSYQALNRLPDLHQAMIDLESTHLWRQSVKLLSGFDHNVKRLYLSLFFFEEDANFWQKISEDSLAVASTKATSPRQMFSLAETHDYLPAINEREIFIMPWHKFPEAKEEDFESPLQKCHTKKKSEQQLEIHCVPKKNFLSSYTKTITIAQFTKPAALATYLLDLLKVETQEFAYLKLFPRIALDKVSGFLELFKTKVRSLAEEEKQKIFDQWEDQLNLEEKSYLEALAAVLPWFTSIEERISKYASYIRESSPQLAQNHNESPDSKSWMVHLGKVMTVIEQDLVSSLFANPSCTQDLQDELWRKFSLGLFQQLANDVYFQVDPGNGFGILRSTLAGYVQFLILKSMHLHEKDPIQIGNSDKYMLDLDRLVTRMHNFTLRGKEVDPFTRKYVLHLISRFGDLFNLVPKSQDHEISQHIQHTFQQVISLYKLVKQDGDDPEQIGKLALEKFAVFHAEVVELKATILALVLGELKEFLVLKENHKAGLYLQQVLQSIAEREMNELFHNANKLARLMEQVQSQRKNFQTP